eukprot:g6784.t1
MEWFGKDLSGFAPPAPAPPGPQVTVSEPVPVVLELLKHDSKEVCERALGLVDALVSSNPLHRDAVWHHGGIPLVVQLLKSGPAEQLQRACSLLKTLASSQKEAQMADNITRAGALVPLIDLLGDESRLELAAAVLAQLANHHADNQSAIGAATGAVPKLSLGRHW